MPLHASAHKSLFSAFCFALPLFHFSPGAINDKNDIVMILPLKNLYASFRVITDLSVKVVFIIFKKIETSHFSNEWMTEKLCSHSSHKETNGRKIL